MAGLRGLVWASAALALAASINTASVALQRRHGFLTGRFGRGAWPVHLALITPPWAIFLLSLRRLDTGTGWPLPLRFRPLGAVVVAGAGLLWALAFKELGPARMANGYFFGVRDTGLVMNGVFRWLENPVYDSYALGLIGQGLLRADARYLVLAAESILLLNSMEAGVENGPFGRRHLGL